MASPVREIVIPYSPRHVFLPFHQREHRFAAGVAHRRAGKTVACVNDIVPKAIQCPRRGLAPGRYAYIAPQLNQAKDIAWSYLKRATEPLWAKPPNESELYVELLNEARIRIYGADNPDRIRGGYLDHVVLDEYADMRPSVWGEIIRPMLSDYQGGATFIGTPKGRNSFWEIYERAKADPRWFTFFLPASETGILPQTELDDARQDMTPEQFEQEYECSFEAAITGAYFGKEMAQAERDGRIRGDFEYDPDIVVHTAWDLGVGDSTAIWWFQAVGREIHVIDHYEAQGMSAKHFADVCFSKPYKRGNDYVPHDAKVREWANAGPNGTAKARIQVMMDLKLSPKLVPDHKIMDGINAARMLFPRIVFHGKQCFEGLEALRQYRVDYDEKVRAFKNTPKHDWTSHTADAFRYMAMAYQDLAPSAQPKEDRIVAVGPTNTATFDDLWNTQPKRGRQRI